MKVIFWGTPDFAVHSLEAILKSNHTVSAVVTVPDKAQGRGLKITCSPVKEFAVKNNITVLQPETMKAPELPGQLAAIDADIYVIVAFKILPPSIFNIPKYGSFNLHGSLLPKYRGAAPIQWALINGETTTGVTTFKLDQKVDTGNVYISESIPILPEDTFGEVHDKLAVLGASVTVRTLDLIESGQAILLPQKNELATPAPKITKEICRIDWSRPAESVLNLIRALSPFPGAYFTHKDQTYKVFSGALSDRFNLGAGEIYTSKDEISVGCGQGAVKINSIQKEGRKKMTAEEFLRGYSL